MMPSRLRNEQGMTLLTVIFMLMVVGLLLGLAGQTWSDLMQREREEELLFRGDQYRRALQSYYEKTAGGGYPTSLDQLLEDTRFLTRTRHIRQLWPDPFTGEEFELILDPPDRIKGVRSRSQLKPFKTDGFPEEYRNFANAGSYAQWEFVFIPKSTNATSSSPAATAVPAAPVAPQ